MDVTVPWWAGTALTLTIVAMLAIDLFLHRDNHEIKSREAATWSAIWIAVGLGFGLVLWLWQGGEVAATYDAGHLIEKALSVDNVFIFAMIFAAFAVLHSVEDGVPARQRGAAGTQRPGPPGPPGGPHHDGSPRQPRNDSDDHQPDDHEPDERRSVDQRS